MKVVNEIHIQMRSDHTQTDSAASEMIDDAWFSIKRKSIKTSWENDDVTDLSAQVDKAVDVLIEAGLSECEVIVKQVKINEEFDNTLGKNLFKKTLSDGSDMYFTSLASALRYREPTIEQIRDREKCLQHAKLLEDERKDIDDFDAILDNPDLVA